VRETVVRVTAEAPAPGVNGRAAVLPPDRRHAWTAEIEWRHGAAGSRFCVIARNGQGPGDIALALARSDRLEWPPAGPASVQAMTEAAEQLEAALLAAGWKALPRRDTWYAGRFAWDPDSSPPTELGPTSPAPPVGVQPVGAERDELATAEPAHRRLPVAIVAILVVASAGLLLATGLGGDGGDDSPAVDPAPATRPIVHGGLRLDVATGWIRGDAVPLPGFRRPLELRNAGERLSAVVERLPATSATLLPALFERTLTTAPPRPEVVRLASGRPAWRYRFAREDGSVAVLYAAPTTGGVATAACVGPAVAGLPRRCHELASTITVPGSRPLEPSTRAAFYSRLPAAVRDLDRARGEHMSKLSAAPRARGQAAAAQRLVRVHEAAAATLAPLTSRGDGVPTATVGALSTMATAYRAVASAARARSPERYADVGRAAGEADADLRRTLARAAAAATAASPGTLERTERVAREPAPHPPETDLTPILLAVLLGAGILLCIRVAVRRAR
jgi:hypothetical protein